MALNLRSKLELTRTDPGLVLSFQATAPQPDEYLEQRLGRDYLEYLKMQRDCEVRRCMTRLINSIVGRNVIVTPASESRADRKSAAFIQDLIGYEQKRSPIRYERMNVALLRTGKIIGFSVLRIDWVNDGELVLPHFEFIPQRRFIFSYPEPDRRDIPTCTDEALDPTTDIVIINGYELRLLTKRAPYTGERCPKGRFLVYTFDSESPWGMGLGYSVYPWWQVKREATTSLLMRSDLDGQPPAIGTHPANFKDDHPAVQRLERFLEGISPNNWARLPEGFTSSIMDTIGKAGAEVQNSLITIANHEICKVILGEILYSEKASGSYAANISQVEDRETSLIDGYCNLLDEQLIEFWQQIHEYNRLPGDPAVVHRETRADERTHEVEKAKQEAKKARVDLDKELADLGIRLKPGSIAEIYGEEYVDTTAIKDGEDKQALVATLGVGGTQALISFLSSLQQLGMNKENAIAALTGIFGVPSDVAKKIIPDQQQAEAGTGAAAPPASLEDALNSALGDQGGTGNAAAPDQTAADQQNALQLQAFSEAPNYRESPGLDACIECKHAVDGTGGLQCGRYAFAEVDPEGICDDYVPSESALTQKQRTHSGEFPTLPFFVELEPGYEFTGDTEYSPDLEASIARIREKLVDADRELQFEETLKGAIDFAAKPKSTTAGAVKQRQCNPAKSHWCGAPGTVGSCVPLTKQCKSKPTGTAQQVANYVGTQASAATPATPTATKTAKKTSTKKAATTSTPATTAAPTTTPKTSTQKTAATPPTPSTGPVKVNQPELDKSRADLENRVGKATVTKAEANVKRIMDDPDTNVYIRVGSASTLEQILGDRFKTSAELGIDTHQIPHLKGGYQAARNRVEAKTLGYDEKGTKPEDRPIYGYIAGKDLNGDSHADVSQAYGSIAVKLKGDVKDRTTFTAADSFKSGIASPIKHNGPPPPPNAASIAATTRHGYDVDKLPKHYPSYYNDKSINDSQLHGAARAKTIDDLVDVGATTGNRYIEAQVHGKVTPKDIAEIHFSPKGVGDRPNAAIAKFAKDNKVDLFVDGKKLGANDLDDLINPPKDVRSKRLQDLATALDKEDFASLADHAEKLHNDAHKVKLDSGESDKHLKLLYSEAGYDRLPKVVNSTDIDKVWNDGGVLMVRGVSKDPKDPNKYLKQFQTGNYYVGNGIYGNGTYVGHSGDASGKTFVHRPSSDAAATTKAKNAVNNVAKHGYMSSSTVNFRMAMDKNSKVILQSELKNEQRSLEKKVDAWHAAEEAKIKARPDPTNNSASAKKYAAAYKQAEANNADYLTAKPKQAGTTQGGIVDVTYHHEVTVKGKSDIVRFNVMKDSDFFGRISWKYIDETGNPQTAKTKKDAVAKGHQAAVTRKTEKDALTATGLATPPVKGKKGQLSAAQQGDLIKLDDRVRKMKTMLGLDHNGESNLAVIKGYDAVALNQSYQKDVFMNLLNRSAVYVQKDPLDWNRAKTKGAA